MTATDPALAAAQAEADALPFIDFDDVKPIAKTRIGGEIFLVPPMPVDAIEYYQQISTIRIDDPNVNALDVVKSFILRCLFPADRDRARAALDGTAISLKALMEKGGELIRISTAFPTELPSGWGSSSSPGSVGTTAASLPPPAGPSSPPQPPPESS